MVREKSIIPPVPMIFTFDFGIMFLKGKGCQRCQTGAVTAKL